MIISIISTKGGTGKTTLTASLAAYAADKLGKKTLAIDCDPQPTLSTFYPTDGDARGGITKLITDRSLSGEVIVSTTIPNLDVVQNDDPNNELSSYLRGVPDGYVRLRSILKRSPLAREYDYILIDTPGAVSPMQMMGAIAGDILLSPVPPETLSAREFMRGTATIYNSTDALRESFGIELSKTLVVIWRQTRTGDATKMIDAIYRQFESETELPITVLKTLVPILKVFTESATFGEPPHRDNRALELVSDIFTEVQQAMSAEERK